MLTVIVWLAGPEGVTGVGAGDPPPPEPPPPEPPPPLLGVVIIKFTTVRETDKSESVTVTVTASVELAVGVPEIVDSVTPEVKVKPAGTSLALHVVYVPLPPVAEISTEQSLPTSHVGEPLCVSVGPLRVVNDAMELLVDPPDIDIQK